MPRLFAEASRGPRGLGPGGRVQAGRAQVLFTKRSDNFILELGTRGEKITSRQSRFEFVPCATEKLDLRARSFNLPLAAAGRMRI
jgi:hypothetical protein